MKNIIFDLDGTLIDSMPIWTNVGSDFLIKNGITPPKNLMEVIKKQTLPETALYFKNQWQLPMSTEDIINSVIGMVEHAYRYNVPLKPYVREYLQMQKALGVKMCVLTASEISYVNAAMKRLDILDYFEFVLTCTQVGFNKNDPRIFLTAMQKLGGTIDNTIVFEDAPYAIRTAKTAGFNVIAVADENTKNEEDKIRQMCDRYISSFFELIT